MYIHSWLALETCRVPINQNKHKLHLVFYMLFLFQHWHCRAAAGTRKKGHSTWWWWKTYVVWRFFFCVDKKFETQLTTAAVWRTTCSRCEWYTRTHMHWQAHTVVTGALNQLNKLRCVLRRKLPLNEVEYIVSSAAAEPQAAAEAATAAASVYVSWAAAAA